MPRTKRPTKTAERAPEGGETVKKFERLVAERMAKVDNMVQLEVREVELAFKILTESIPKEYFSMTIGQLKNELLLKEVPTNAPAGRLSRRRSQSARTASHDDAVPTSRTTYRRSRSADTCHRAPSSRHNGRRLSRSVYRTPAYNKNAPTAYPAITPKVAPHMPLTVLRQPRQGEMVVSMTGSPVMVPSFSSMQAEEKANCNILLKDGTMLSLQPTQLRNSQAYIPFSLMDASVLSQLKTLKENLDKVVKMGEKNVKK